jgi:diguanylate cyclase (GGDEF)-like protein
MKLKLKLPLILIPLIVLPAFIEGGLMWWEVHNFSETKTFAQIETQLNQVEYITDAFVTAAQSNIHLFSEYQIVEKYFLAESEEERYSILYRPLQKTLTNIQHNYPDYYELRVILPSGLEDVRIVNNGLLNRTEDEGNSKLFQAISAAKDDVTVHFAINPDNGDWVCYLFKRIKLVNLALKDETFSPSPRGYLAITISLDSIYEQISRIVYGTDGGIFMTDENFQPIGAAEQLTWIAAAAQALRDLPRFNESGFRQVQLNGKTFHLQSRRVQEGLWIHAIISGYELSRVGRSLTKYSILGTSLTTLLCISLIFYVFKVQVFAPISMIREAFTRLTEDEDLVQVIIERDDEISDLGAEFNQMSRELKRSNDQIRNIAYSDNLTRLPNRYMFYKTLCRAIERAQIENNRLAVLFIDLDNFKQVNDTLGHSVGDKLLMEVSTRLKESLRLHDFSYRGSVGPEEYNVSRLGGDEFTVLLINIESFSAVQKIAERLLATIKFPFILANREHYVTSSIGIAIFPDDGTTAETLTQNADMAMYQAKANGKSCYEFYSQGISQRAHERSILEQRLRVALTENNFELHYQPILNAKTLKVTGLEALLRWSDPEMGITSPDTFIPIAEEIGVIQEIGKWILAEACRQLQTWREAGLTELTLCLNVSGLQLESHEFIEQVQLNMKTYQLPPSSLLFELTESSLVESRMETLLSLEILQMLGIKIALDDFGTGYSSLSYLRTLPINVLKIDRSFIHDLKEENNNVLLSSIITMAHALNLEVTAEGVEEREQFEFLRDQGCNSLQGCLFCRPQPAADITGKIRSGELQIETISLTTGNS